MKKSIFAVMAFVVAAMLVGCSKDKENSEVSMTVSEITDSTAVIRCEYSPVKSISYKLQIGGSLSEDYSESTELTILNLKAGKKYDVVATIYDAEHNVVGTTVVSFITTGEPDNTTVINTVTELLMQSVNEITITISNVTDSTAIATFLYTPEKTAYYTFRFFTYDKYERDNYISDQYTESMKFKISSLAKGTTYSISTSYYTAGGSQIGVQASSFTTTGEYDYGKPGPGAVLTPIIE